MPSKNDISAYTEIQNKNILKKHANTEQNTGIKNYGRPPKAKEELENYRVNFQLTQAEGEKLERLAGIATVNMFVKHFLRNQTELFD